MITDGETDCVYLSDLLPQRHPWVADDLTRLLTGNGVEVRTIAGTKDFWCRDYMPIQVEVNQFVQFYYQPDYLRGRFRHLITNSKVSRARCLRGSASSQDFGLTAETCPLEGQGYPDGQGIQGKPQVEPQAGKAESE